jgi:hypothetical protein
MDLGDGLAQWFLAKCQHQFKASSVLTMALMAASYMPLLSSTGALSESRELTHPVEQRRSLKYNFLRRTRDPKGQGFYFAGMQPDGMIVAPES